MKDTHWGVLHAKRLPVPTYLIRDLALLYPRKEALESTSPGKVDYLANQLAPSANSLRDLYSSPMHK